MSDDDDRQAAAAAEEAEATDCTGDAALSWKCRPSLEELYQYMDGVMDDSRQQLIRSHLGDCDGCDDLYHFQTGLRQLLSTRCQSELPKDLPQRVFRAITDDLP